MLSFLKRKNVWITDTVGIFKATFLFHLKKFQLGGGGSDSALAKWTCHCALPLPVCKCPPQTVLFRLLVPGKTKKDASQGVGVWADVLLEPGFLLVGTTGGSCDSSASCGLSVCRARPWLPWASRGVEQWTAQLYVPLHVN